MRGLGVQWDGLFCILGLNLGGMVWGQKFSPETKPVGLYG
jgi:hypothetical protein